MMPNIYFEYSIPEENEEYKLHCQAGDFHSAIWEYAQWLRGICKHGNPDEFNAQKCREKLHELLVEHNVDL